MIKSILIIDDEQTQAESVAKAFKQQNSDFFVDYAFEEDDIIRKVENTFYNVAVVDLRMDRYEISGFEIIKKIIEVNPFANVIIVSAFTAEYYTEIQELIPTGKIQGLVPKQEFNEYIDKISENANRIIKDLDSRQLLNSKALAKIYAQSKLETDTSKKGIMFEEFTALLFGTMGYKTIYKRVKDKSLNEVDLVVRNDIEDSFLQRFGRYFLIECKNKPNEGVNKNDFIIFNNKLNNTNELASFGILMSTGYITRNTYYEALRESKGNTKIVFISNPEIEKLINTNDIIEEFKKIIDSQVKDN